MMYLEIYADKFEGVEIMSTPGGANLYLANRDKADIDIFIYLSKKHIKEIIKMHERRLKNEQYHD